MTKDSPKELCEHEQRLKLVVETMPSEDDIGVMAARFKAISEPSRLKILLALSCGELCVEHLTQAVGGNQSAVSHQLKTLKDNKIIKCKRAGKQVIYAISDEHIVTMINVAKEHLNCNE
jgi:ArsR family transcriptional regulator